MQEAINREWNEVTSEGGFDSRLALSTFSRSGITSSEGLPALGCPSEDDGNRFLAISRFLRKTLGKQRNYKSMKAKWTHFAAHSRAFSCSLAFCLWRDNFNISWGTKFAQSILVLFIISALIFGLSRPVSFNRIPFIAEIYFRARKVY